jgi:hypothetical protein
MKVTRVVAVASFLLLTATQAQGQSVSAAQQTLETARANLAKAVQRIEKDPPSTADLEAAHAAVGALKDAIDAGAEHEAKDLEYAKTVLAARKELRTQREYVEQRRANVHIHNHRRTLDGVVATLNERTRRIEGKDATPKDFDDARSAVQAVKRTLDEARQFGKQDPKFAAYLAEVDATVGRVENTIDDRWTLIAVDKHRALLDESRKELSTAMAALAKDSSDANFEAADRAATAVTKRVDEGKVFETRESRPGRRPIARTRIARAPRWRRRRSACRSSSARRRSRA